jgi:hypothetical protein
MFARQMVVPRSVAQNPFAGFQHLQTEEQDDDAEASLVKKRADSPPNHSHVPRTEPHGQVLIEEEEEEEEEEENEEEKEDEEEDDDDDQEPLQVKPRSSRLRESHQPSPRSTSAAP